MSDITKTIAELKELITKADEKPWQYSGALRDAMRNALPELIAEYDAAVARAEKAEAALNLVAKHQGEHQDAEIALYTRLELAEEHAEQMQADRRWLAGQVVDALGKTLQGKYLMPPEKKGHPLTEDKETAITAWVDAAHKATSKAGEEV